MIYKLPKIIINLPIMMYKLPKINFIVPIALQQHNFKVSLHTLPAQTPQTTPSSPTTL